MFYSRRMLVTVVLSGLILLSIPCLVTSDVAGVILHDPNGPTDNRKWGKALAAQGPLLVLSVDAALDGDPVIYVFSESILGAQDWAEIAAIPAFASAGYRIAVDGLHIATGDYEAPEGRGVVWTASSLGAADWSSSVTYLTGSGLEAVDQFGNDAAIDGLRVVFGASGYDQLGMSDRGAVFVFTESSAGAKDWQSNEHFIQASDSPLADGFPKGTGFGDAIDIEGRNIAVGASIRNYGEGAVYIFTESAAGAGNFQSTETKIEHDSYNTGDYYGEQVALNGLYLAVGVPGWSWFGRVIIFSESSSGALDWNDNKVFISGETCNEDAEEFGESLAFEGTRLLIGARFTDYPPALDRAGGLFMLDYDVLGDWTDPNVTDLLPPEPDGRVNGGWWGSVVASAYPNYYVSSPTYDMDGVWWSGHVVANPCAYGFEGTDCHDIDDCASSPCLNNGTCYDTGVYSFRCDCSTAINSVGTTCQIACNNGVPNAPSYMSCDCSGTGATGTSCNVDQDDCESNPCLNGGLCSDNGAATFPLHNNEFNCSCANTGFEGSICEFEIIDCLSSPCTNGVCYENPVASNGALCNCTGSGFDGSLCQNNIDDCLSNPCQHNGVCSDRVLPGFDCNCTDTRWEGPNCEFNIDDCLSSPCLNGGVCDDRNTGYACDCTNTGHIGDTCDVYDTFCFSNPCLNGGTCQNQATNSTDWICDCLNAYVGKDCSVSFTDGCSLSLDPCLNGGVCEVGSNKVKCDCLGTGYTGRYCDIFEWEIEDCDDICQNGGVCFDPTSQLGDMYCDCNGTQYSGATCEIPLFCNSSPCQNGANCVESMDMCSCPSNFTGAFCDVLVSNENAKDNNGTGLTDSPTDDPKSADESGNLDGSGTTTTESILLATVIALIVMIVAAACYIWKRKKKVATTTDYDKNESLYTMPA